MPTTSVTIRMDENLKKEAEVLFADMGLNMTTAFTVFAKAAVREGRIPFEIRAYSEPNANTIAAMRDAVNGKNLSRTYDSVEKVMKALLDDSDA